VAASDRPGSLSFLCNVENSGGSKISPKHVDEDFIYDRPHTAIVVGVALDDIFTSDDFDVVLMDMEGGEFKAIQRG